MKKRSILILVFAIVLVNIFATTNVNAQVASLSDIIDKFNENAAEDNSESFNLTAAMCSADQIAASVCQDGDLVIKTVMGEEVSNAVYTLTGTVLSSSSNISDYYGLVILIKSLGDVNGFNYAYKDITATLDSDISDFTVEDDGLFFELTSDEGYDVELDIAKQIPLYTGRRVSINTDGVGSGKFTIAKGNENFDEDDYTTAALIIKDSSSIKVKATADEGSKFVKWNLNGVDYSTEATITLTVDKDINLLAIFEEDLKEISKGDVTFTLPNAGDEIKKVHKKEDEWEWDEPDVDPEVTTKTEGLIVNAYWTTGSGLGEEESEPFFGVFEKGKEYYLLIDFMADDGYILTEDFLKNVKINGLDPFKIGEVEVDRYGQCIFKFKPAQTYNIIDGDKQTFSGKDIVIKADGDLEDLVGINVDKQKADEKNYTTENGSTILTLKAEYLSTLEPGDHTVTFVYNNGSVDATVTIPEQANPKTLDNIESYCLMATISGLGLAGLVILNKKTKLSN